MAYTLASTNIRSPHRFRETNSTQVAQQRTLGGTVGRDYYGSNKRVWILEYENVNIADYNIIYNIYAAHLSAVAAQTWQVDETNYPISQTNVHIDLLEREFSVKGSDYLSSFTLILTEA